MRRPGFVAGTRGGPGLQCVLGYETVCTADLDWLLGPYAVAGGPADTDRVAAMLPAAVAIRTFEADRRGLSELHDEGRRWFSERALTYMA